MYKEVNIGINLLVQIDFYVVDGDEYKFFCIVKGGGLVNKMYFYQEIKVLLMLGKLKNYLVEKMCMLGMVVCFLYYIVFVIGGIFVEMNFKMVKLVFVKYYDELLMEGNEYGQVFCDVELEKELLIEV